MPHETDKDLQSKGREANDAQPLNKMGGGKGGTERYPPARADDALETKPAEGRSFEPKVRNETAPKPDDLQGPAGDPAEGKR
jgi:hypothetical protein